MVMLVDKQEEVRDGSVCDNSGLQSGGADGHAGGQTGSGERKGVLILLQQWAAVDKQEEMRDSSVSRNSGLQSGRADGHAGGQTGRGKEKSHLLQKWVTWLQS